jgi:hypothetical protein
MIKASGSSLSSAQNQAYFALHRGLSMPVDGATRVVNYDPASRADLCSLAEATKGHVYVAAEELEGDVSFKALDLLYRRVGLRRTRQVWVAYNKRQNRPVGAAIAYRGPLGLNFSFLENRCDLLLAPSLSEKDLGSAAAALLNAVLTAYENFELEHIPVIASEDNVSVLLNLGAEFIRRYCQCIWLKSSYPRSYRHVDSFYSKILDRAGKRGLQPLFALENSQ